MASVCVCDSRQHFSASEWGSRVMASMLGTRAAFVCLGVRACVCLVRRLGVGYCPLAAPLAPELGKQQPFFVTAHFSGRPLLFQGSALDLLGCHLSAAPAGPGGTATGLQRLLAGPRGRAAGPPGRLVRSSALAPAARPPALPPPPSPGARGKWEF